MSNIEFITAAELCSDEYHNKLMLERKLRKEQAIKAIEDHLATFDDLVVIEPALKWLSDDALDYKKQSKGKKHVCANERWYGYFRWEGLGIKARLEKIVGFGAFRQTLKNTYCYDLAYEHIYKQLPNCKNCNCF